MMKTRNILLYQYSKKDFDKVIKDTGLIKKLGITTSLSHQKAILQSSETKQELRKKLSQINKMYNERIRIN